MTNYSEAGWPQPGGQPPQQPYGPPAGGQPSYGQPQYGQPSYEQPSYEQPSYEQPSYEQPPYGQPQYEQQPPYGQPPYEQPPYEQPPYGQPPYSPPGGYPPGPGGSGFGPYGQPPARSKAPWLIGGVAVLVAAGVAVALVLTLGGSGGTSGSAKAAVDKLLKADIANDVKAAQAVTREPLRSAIRSDSSPDKSYSIGNTHENGDTAEVEATIVGSDDSKDTLTFDVRKQNGTWKVCDVEEGGLDGGGSGGTAQAPAPSIPSGTDFPTDLPSVPTGLPNPTGSLCVTPDGSSPICIPN